MRKINLLIVAVSIFVGTTTVCGQTMDKDTVLIQEVQVQKKLVHERESSLKILAPLKDIPMTTSTVSENLLKEKHVNNLNEALKYMTGIHANVTYGGFQTFRLRGFGSPVYLVDGAVDERMNFSSSAPVTSLAAVSRIEFIKGPASALYGHSAVGGILNIVRKQPVDHFIGNVDASVGSWNNRNVIIDFGNQLCKNFSYRLAANLGNSDGWRDNKRKIGNIYFAVNGKLSDRDNIEFRVGAVDDFYGTETGLPTMQYDIYSASTDDLIYHQGDLPDNMSRSQRYNDPSDFLKHKDYNFSLRYAHQFKNGSHINYMGTYTNDDINYFSTEELTYLTSDDAIYDQYYLSDGQKVYISLDSLQRSYPLRFAHKTKTLQNTVDYHFNAKTGSIKHQLLAGISEVYINRVSYKGYNLGTDVYGPGLYATVSVVDPILNQGYLKTQFSAASIYHENSVGLYVHDLLTLSKNWKAMVGLRYDYYRLSYQNASISSGRHLTDKEDKSKINNNALTGRVGIVYEPNDNLSIYGSWGNFFKPTRSFYNSNYIYLNKDGKQFYPEDGKELYKPESGYQAEIGAKYSLSNKLSIAPSFYYIRKHNIAEYLGETADDQKVYGQVGIVDSKGMDLDFQYIPVEGLRLNAGYSYDMARYRDFASNDYTEGDDAGNRLKEAPLNQFFAWAHYAFQTKTLSGFALGLGTEYTDKVYTDADNEYEMPDYWLLDGEVSYSAKRVSISFNLNNILNTNYFSSAIYSNQYIPGEEQNFKISLRYHL